MSPALRTHLCSLTKLIIHKGTTVAVGRSLEISSCRSVYWFHTLSSHLRKPVIYQVCQSCRLASYFVSDFQQLRYHIHKLPSRKCPCSNLEYPCKSPTRNMLGELDILVFKEYFRRNYLLLLNVTKHYSEDHQYNIITVCDNNIILDDSSLTYMIKQ